MPLKVTEKWTTRRLSLQVPWTAHREWDVTGAASEHAALAAVDPITPTIRVAQLNNGHPYSPLLMCQGPYVLGHKGLDFWTIGADYGIPSGGQFGDPGNLTEISWSNARSSEPVDMDVGDDAVKSLPILNSNGQPPESPLSRPTSIKILSITKTMPGWDPGWNLLWENAVNKSDVMLPGGVPLPAHHGYCTDIIPAAAFNLGAPTIRMLFRWEIVFDDSLGKYPFQHRLMDSGTYGFASGVANAKNSSTFWNGSEQHTARIRLNNDGRPYPGADTNDALKVKTPDENLSTPVINPAIPADWQHEHLTASKAWIRWYRKTRIADMTQLFSGLVG